MPLYDLVAVVKAAVPRRGVAEVLRRAALTVLDAGGVVTDVKSYGLRELAYPVRRAGETHVEATYVQLTFATRPAALTGLSHDLRTDERVMRYTLLRRPAVPPIKARELRVLRRDLAAGAAVSDEAEEEWEEEFEEEEDTAAEGVAASEPPALEPATHQPGLDGSGRAQRRHADAADGESAAEGVAQPSASALPLPAAPASSPAAPPPELYSFRTHACILESYCWPDASLDG